MPNIHVEWDEPLEKLVKPEVVQDALRQAVREHVLNDAEFRQNVIQAVQATGTKMTTEAIAQALKEELFSALQQKNGLLRKELNQCLADFKSIQTMHASDYAKRRHDELLKVLLEMDSN